METDGDRILGFAAFGVDAGEIMSSVQIAMIAGLPYTALRDAVLAHPTLLEGLGPLFSLPSAFEWASGRHFPEKSCSSITDFSVSLAITIMERNRGCPRTLIACLLRSPVDVRRCAFVLSYLS